MAGTDKAMNVGRMVKISGRQVRVRELSWRSLRALTKDLHDLVRVLKEENPDVDWSSLSNAQLADVIFNSLLSAMDTLGGWLERLIAEASELEVADVGDLGISDFQKLLLAVVEEQTTAVDDFFALKAGVGKLTRPADDQSTPTGKKG